MFLDADGRVPGRYWLLDPRTGDLLKSGDRPADRVPIEVAGHDPYVLICSDTPPAYVVKIGSE